MTYTPIPRGTQNWDVPLNAALAQLDANITSASGTALQAANNLSDLTNAPQARINLGLTGLANALSNMTASSNPAVTSDNTQGYSIGSTWFNTTTNSMFVATSVATGAAVWLQIPPTFVDRTSSQSVGGVKTFTSPMNSTHTSDESSFNSSYTATNTNNAAYAYTGNATTGRYADSRVTGDTTGRFTVLADGNMSWGPGNAGRDVNLYRSAANTLTTDDNFQAANITTDPWTSYSPTWTAATTNPVIGNGTLSGAYAVIGKTCHFRILMNSGTTTTYGSGVYTFTLPVTASAASGVAGAYGQALSAGTRVMINGLFTANTASLSAWGPTSTANPVIIQLGSAGAAAAGWTASTANQFIRISGTYETA